MAASIFHGPPGSFKSATATWFEIIPALRKGRLVITNIEGIYPLEEIEIALQEEFPETAQLWRLSSQNEDGLNLWRNWFCWAPVGALILIDEVQDVYPTERTFKPEIECVYKHISTFKDLLPSHWYDYHIEKLDSIKPEQLSSADIDDTGRELFNEHGHIIYPKNLKEAYMRHRKYNWDIVVATPDITSVHKYIRNVSEEAYCHKYFSGLSWIPYFYRRPRIHLHPAKLDGKTITKGDATNWKKVPLDVHKCYKSTATGAITAGRGKNIASLPLAIMGGAILVWVIAAIVFLSNGDDGKTVSQNTNSNSVKTTQKAASSSSSNASVQTSDSSIHILELPYNATKMYVSGVVVKQDGAALSRHIIFTLETPDYGELSLNNVDLLEMGYTTRFRGSCNVTIYQGQSEYTAFCNPVRYQPPQQDNYDSEPSEA
ncbi:zonular occludens toxin domain-containing protein [Pseudoalteromonas piratica]|uniref:Zona occludens toxin-like protein n=1 Tax=Pseudoalteromonas piratica TaxID=1348114 RepID=A0A0A7EKL2_9GAMM|nr:zonular occludens toxin domain-containing protein [Pseudoalteromonas piratica]AIY67083.1 zona occludens toxin-like protein [Pseudoalteromonas piratica]